jgi:hypothetical protein
LRSCARVYLLILSPRSLISLELNPTPSFGIRPLVRVVDATRLSLRRVWPWLHTLRMPPLRLARLTADRIWRWAAMAIAKSR